MTKPKRETAPAEHPPVLPLFEQDVSCGVGKRGISCTQFGLNRLQSCRVPQTRRTGPDPGQHKGCHETGTRARGYPPLIKNREERGERERERVLATSSAPLLCVISRPQATGQGGALSPARESIYDVTLHPSCQTAPGHSLAAATHSGLENLEAGRARFN